MKRERQIQDSRHISTFCLIALIVLTSGIYCFGQLQAPGALHTIGKLDTNRLYANGVLPQIEELSYVNITLMTAGNAEASIIQPRRDYWITESLGGDCFAASAYSIEIKTRDSVIQPKPDRWKWNKAKYFQRLEYKMKPDKKILDWSNFNETWDGKQVTLWALYALAGVAHGMGEAYHADPYVFETRWNVGESSFFGSDSWERNYIGNNPANRHKQEWLGNFGRDIWHTQNHIDFFGTAIATYAISGRNHPKKYKIANFLAGVGIRSLFATVTYQTLRR